MTVVLYNYFHAGDVVLSRTIIGEILRANPDRAFELQCRARYAYLWRDLGPTVAPLENGQERVERGEPSINLWFSAIDGMLAKGLTYANQVDTYNIQAKAPNLRPIEYDVAPRFVRLPSDRAFDVPRFSVLVENGPVLSGQPVLDIDPHLSRLSSDFPHATFFCSSPPPSSAFAARNPRDRTRVGFDRGRANHNIVDVSAWNLCDLSALSNRCSAIVARLSAVLVCSFTEQNYGRKRIIFGQPLGCPIWDEKGLCYVQTYDALKAELETLLR